MAKVEVSSQVEVGEHLWRWSVEAFELSDLGRTSTRVECDGVNKYKLTKHRKSIALVCGVATHMEDAEALVKEFEVISNCACVMSVPCTGPMAVTNNVPS